MTQTSLPAARAAFIDPSGRPTPEFYRFLESLSVAQLGNASQADIESIRAQMAQLQAEIDGIGTSGYPTLQVMAPLLSAGLLQNGFAQLSWNGTTSDVPEGSNLYYTAARLWAALKAALVAGSNITLTPDDGTQTITVAANGGGSGDDTIAWLGL